MDEVDARRDTVGGAAARSALLSMRHEDALRAVARHTAPHRVATEALELPQLFALHAEPGHVSPDVTDRGLPRLVGGEVENVVRGTRGEPGEEGGRHGQGRDPGSRRRPPA